MGALVINELIYFLYIGYKAFDAKYPKMVRHTENILQHLLQDFGSVSDHVGTLCNKVSLNPFVPRCNITEKFRSHVFFSYIAPQHLKGVMNTSYRQTRLQEVFCKKAVFKNSTNSCNFIKKEPPT